MGYEHIAHYAQKALKHIEGRRNGTIKSVPTPWKRYNDIGIDGLEFHSITLIAAMSGGGKTAVSNQIVNDSFDLAPSLGHVALDFNFEMRGESLVMRNISANIGMTMQQIQSAQGYLLAAEEQKEIENYVNTKLIKKPYYIVDEPASVWAIKEELKDFYKQFGKKFVASLDHTILTKRLAGENNLQDTLQNLGIMCTEAKKQFPVAWIILSQLNRSIEDSDRKDKCSSSNFPVKADIFGSDALYQHADIVTVIHRPYLLGLRNYGPDKIPTDKNTLFFHNLKVRNGDTNILMMQADFANMRIIDKIGEAMAPEIPFPKTFLTTKGR